MCNSIIRANLREQICDFKFTPSRCNIAPYVVHPALPYVHNNNIDTFVFFYNVVIFFLSHYINRMENRSSLSSILGEAMEVERGALYRDILVYNPSTLQSTPTDQINLSNPLEKPDEWPTLADPLNQQVVQVPQLEVPHPMLHIPCKIPQPSHPSTQIYKFNSGGFCLVIDGFVFSKKRVNKNDIKWVCSKNSSGCPVVCATDPQRVRLNSMSGIHNHAPPDVETYSNLPSVSHCATSAPQSHVDSALPAPHPVNSALPAPHPINSALPAPPIVNSALPSPPTVNQHSALPHDNPPLLEPTDQPSILPPCRLSTNRQGGHALIVEGFQFSYKKSTLSCHIWRCSRYKTKCKATCKTNAEKDKLVCLSGQHNHQINAGNFI